MLEIILVVISAIYLVEYVVFFQGVLRAGRLPRLHHDHYPHISVLVAARNEEPNIRRCVEALVAQDYPDDRFQLIVIDDDSDDQTLPILQSMCDDFPGLLTVVSTRSEDTHARGKALAIAQGMDHATGEIILLTDADCTPPRRWARGVVEHFLPDVDAYGGFTLIRADDLFSTVQQLDWVHLQTLASAALAFNVPLGLIGNNFAFRRSAYDAVGGYRGVRFTVTEDYALFRAMHRAGSRVVFPCTNDTSMVTEACPSLAAVLHQKQRWSRGGLETGLAGYTVLTIAVLMMASIVVAPFVSPIAWAVTWGTKFGADILVMAPNLRRLGRLGQLRHFLEFEFYFVAQAFVIPFLLLKRRVVWKGRSYES